MKRRHSHQWRLILVFLIAALFTQARMFAAIPETVVGTVAEISGNEILLHTADGQPIRRVTVTRETVIRVENGSPAPLSLIGASSIEVKMNTGNRDAYSILSNLTRTWRLLSNTLSPAAYEP
jgi:hypothetical protein